MRQTVFSATFLAAKPAEKHPLDAIWEAPELVEPPVQHQVGKEDLRGLGFVGNSSHLLEVDDE